MAFFIIASIGIGVAVLYFVVRSMGTNKQFIVDVQEVIDGRSLKVRVEGRDISVVLAGIGFPPNDEKAVVDAVEIVRDIAIGRRLFMEIYKEVQGLMYVTLKSSNGDCLNEIMLEKGLARYESNGLGFIGTMVSKEATARSKEIGIWDKNRDLFKHMTGDHISDEEYMGDGAMIDEWDDEEIHSNS